MGRLSELQAIVHAVVRGELPVAAGAEQLGCDPARLAIYAAFVPAHVRRALDKNYPYLRAMLPPDLWDELCADYIATRPSTAWEVNRSAAGLASYLEERRVAGAAPIDPVHVVMAELEWEQFAVAVDPARIPAPSEVDRITLNPTATALELPYDLLELVASAGEGLSPETPPPPPDPTVVLLYRDPADQLARAERATPALLFGFKVAAEGLDLAAAAAAAGLELEAARAVIDDAARRGLVIAPR